MRARLRLLAVKRSGMGTAASSSTMKNQAAGAVRRIQIRLLPCSDGHTADSEPGRRALLAEPRLQSTRRIDTREPSLERRRFITVRGDAPDVLT